MNKYGVKGIRVENGRVVYRPYIPVAKRHDAINVDGRGQLNPPIKLGKPTDPDVKIMTNYLAAEKTLNQQIAAELNTLYWIHRKYIKSEKFLSLEPDTQKPQMQFAKILDHPLKIDGQVKCVGDLHITKVKKPLFQSIADRRLELKKAKGNKGNVAVNREISYVSAMITWATNHITDLGINNNPLLRFEKFKEVGNTRLVTDLEYQLQYDCANQIDGSILPILFELTLGVVSRGVEVLDLNLSDCTEDGIYVDRRKGSKPTLIRWAPKGKPKENGRLWNAYLRAKARHNDHAIIPEDQPLVLTRDGNRLTQSGLQSAMQRLKKKMKKEGIGDSYWTMHLLKHKGVTESKNKHVAGHKSEAMRNKYDHSVGEFEPGI